MVFDQVNLIVPDMDATLAFYETVGLSIDDAPPWPPGTDARHVDVSMPNGVRLEFDNIEMAAIYAPGLGGSSGALLGFSLPSRDAVDEKYKELEAAGHAGRQAPYDAFWGARYAIVTDPAGNNLGLMSPIDTERKYVPVPGVLGPP